MDEVELAGELLAVEGVLGAALAVLAPVEVELEEGVLLVAQRASPQDSRDLQIKEVNLKCEKPSMNS